MKSVGPNISLWTKDIIFVLRVCIRSPTYLIHTASVCYLMLRRHFCLLLLETLCYTSLKVLTTIHPFRFTFPCTYHTIGSTFFPYTLLYIHRRVNPFYLCPFQFGLWFPRLMGCPSRSLSSPFFTPYPCPIFPTASSL